MNQYPDTEAYMINYPTGIYGEFISGIVSMFLKIIPENKQIEFSEYGNAQLFDEYKFSNYSRTDLDITDQMYDSVEPVDSSKPLVLTSYMFPLWDDLFYYYPSCKNIILTTTQIDLIVQAGNLFFKNVIGEYYNKQNPYGKMPWETLKSRRSFLFEQYNINVPEDLTSVRIQALLQRYLVPSRCFYEGQTPTIDVPNVFYLSTSDIIHNKNKTLTFLSHVTNSNITPRIIETYDRYLAIQEELVRTKMPWATVKT